MDGGQGSGQAGGGGQADRPRSPGAPQEDVQEGPVHPGMGPGVAARTALVP